VICYCLLPLSDRGLFWRAIQISPQDTSHAGKQWKEHDVAKKCSAVVNERLSEDGKTAGVVGAKSEDFPKRGLGTLAGFFPSSSETG